MLKHQEYLKRQGIERDTIKELSENPDLLYNKIQFAITSYANERNENTHDYYYEHVNKLYQLLDDILPENHAIRFSKSYKNLKNIFNI